MRTACAPDRALFREMAYAWSVMADQVERASALLARMGSEPRGSLN